MSSFKLVRSNPNATSPSISTTNCSRPYTGTARFRCSQTTGRKQTPHLRGEGVWNKAALAMTYFPRGLPPKYRRRWHVSRPCSGWERVGPCHFTIGRQGYLALEGGPPSFPLDSSCPVVLAHAPPADRNLPLRGSHPLWPPVPGSFRSASVFSNCRRGGPPRGRCGCQPRASNPWPVSRMRRFGLPPRSLATTWGISVDVSSSGY